MCYQQAVYVAKCELGQGLDNVMAKPISTSKTVRVFVKLAYLITLAPGSIFTVIEVPEDKNVEAAESCYELIL